MYCIDYLYRVTFYFLFHCSILSLSTSLKALYYVVVHRIKCSKNIFLISLSPICETGRERTQEWISFEQVNVQLVAKLTYNNNVVVCSSRVLDCI